VPTDPNRDTDQTRDTDPGRRAGTDPEHLLGLLESFPDPVVVGFRPSRRHVDLHVAPLAGDDRAGAAGLFGMRAAAAWSAVGVTFCGRARHLDSGRVVASGASAAVVVTRDGACSSRMLLDGLDPTSEELGRATGGRVDGSAEGLVVDALHRILGLPSPGDPPSPALLAVTIWAHQVLEVLVCCRRVDWDDALALHPGDPGAGPVGPSDEMLLEATLRAADGFSWAAMHQRAAMGHAAVHELSASEAAWMDATMFGRWVTAALPDPSVAVGMLRAHGCQEVAERLQRVVDGVRRISAPG
jgi:hypothetical protein